MRTTESFKIAIRAIIGNGLRSALTMLGILIGVGAVIMLVAVGNGSSVAVQKQIQALGTNTLIINRQGGFGPATGGRSRAGTVSRTTDLTMKDVTALRDKRANPDIKAVAPTLMAQSVTGAYQGSTYSPNQFIGTSAEYAEIRNYKV